VSIRAKPVKVASLVMNTSSEFHLQHLKNQESANEQSKSNLVSVAAVETIDGRYSAIDTASALLAQSSKATATKMEKVPFIGLPPWWVCQLNGGVV
jgi:hypothetical protein